MGRLPDIALTRIGSIVIALVAAGLMGVAIVSTPFLVAAFAVALLALLGLIVALERPAYAFIGLVLVIAIVPIYAAPSVGSLLFAPGAAAAWLLAGALAWRNALVKGYVFRPTAIDWIAATFALLMAVSLAFSTRTSLSDYVHLMFLWAGPYCAARLLLSDVEQPTRVLAASFALVTIALAPIAILEATGSSNPFFAFRFNPTESAIWATQVDRFGQVRAETSFGHPIAFSMFVAVSALLSVAMGIRSSISRQRYGWYALAAAAVGVQALALSRTGWLMLALGVVLIALVTVRGTIRRRLTVLLVTVGAVVLLTWLVAPAELQVLPGFESHADRIFTSSGEYREALLSRALEPGVLHLWGNSVNLVTPLVSGGNATDNAYIILADTWGLIPTAALVAVAIALLGTAARARFRDEEAETIPPIVAFTSFAALFFVAFITQEQMIIWLLAGSAGAAAERAAVLGSPAPAQEFRASEDRR